LGHARVIRTAFDDDTNARSRTESQSFLLGDPQKRPTDTRSRAGSLAPVPRGENLLPLANRVASLLKQWLLGTPKESAQPNHAKAA
jgi:hypothetical protein